MAYAKSLRGSAKAFAGGPELAPRKLLKLACLYELFRLPDCAAELLLAFRAQLEGLLDVDHALDLLTPAIGGQPSSYAGYVAAFENSSYKG